LSREPVFPGFRVVVRSLRPQLDGRASSWPTSTAAVPDLLRRRPHFIWTALSRPAVPVLAYARSSQSRDRRRRHCNCSPYPMCHSVIWSSSLV